MPEQGSGSLIPDGIVSPGQVYTIGTSADGRIGCYRLESQILEGNGKFDKIGLGSSHEAKEAANTAFNYLKANGKRISGAISTDTKNFIINYQDLNGIGMTCTLALPTLISLSSIVLGKPVISSAAVIGEISIGGSITRPENLADMLQVALNSGAKKIILPITSAADLSTVPPELIGSFSLVFYKTAEDAVYKALGVE